MEEVLCDVLCTLITKRVKAKRCGEGFSEKHTLLPFCLFQNLKYLKPLKGFIWKNQKNHATVSEILN